MDKIFNFSDKILNFASNIFFSIYMIIILCEYWEFSISAMTIILMIKVLQKISRSNDKDNKYLFLAIGIIFFIVLIVTQIIIFPTNIVLIQILKELYIPAITLIIISDILYTIRYYLTK